VCARARACVCACALCKYIRMCVSIYVCMYIYVGLFDQFVRLILEDLEEKKRKNMIERTWTKIEVFFFLRIILFYFLTTGHD
jgi:hypothetical protein